MRMARPSCDPILSRDLKARTSSSSYRQGWQVDESPAPPSSLVRAAAWLCSALSRGPPFSIAPHPHYLLLSNGAPHSPS